MKWLITFETSEVLAKDGKSITPYLDDALYFSSENNGWDYIEKNRETLCKLGENPLVTRLKG